MPKGIKGFQKGVSIWKGRKHSPETKARMSESAIKAGTGLWNRGRVIPITQRELMNKNSTRFKGKKHSLITREKTSQALTGEKNHQWRGGIAEISKRIRGSLKYRFWRESVFLRDNYICQFCNKRGGDLEADHIKPFAYYPELRFEVSNGRTLCLPCHRTTFSYLKKQ